MQENPGEPEHVAGPNCTCTAGYSGWRILADEMKVMSTKESLPSTAYEDQDITACLVLMKKSEGWQPEPGDEEFEKEAFSCFVTGVSKHGVSEFDVDDIEPVKHGVDHALVENWFIDNVL